MNNRIATFDLEANGFLEDATQVWCICILDHETGELLSYGPNDIDKAIAKLDTYDILVGHNAIAYDFPLLRKLYGWEYNKEKRDTLLMSRTQRPNRLSPPHCPNKQAPHSVEAWGYRLGEYKLAHEDWTQYSPEMLERCKQDCVVQHKIYNALLKEGAGEGWENAHRLNAKLFHWLQRQEEYGWLVDRELINKHIATLDRWISRIDSVITPRLPLVVDILETKKDGEYGWVKKPFTKSGEYSRSVRSYFNTLDNNNNVTYPSAPFSRINFRPVDLDSNAEVKDYLLTLGWEPTEWNINNEGKRTSAKFSKEDQFEGIQGSLGRLIARRIQCRQRKSVLEGWRNNIRSDGRISPRVSGMASTGRIRHSGIVNVPNPGSKAFFAKQMRSIFVCKPGWRLVGVDSKSNQIRQLAARMEDDEFTEAVLNGDPHSLNQKRVGGNVSRNAIKAFFYSLIFGAQDAKTAKILKVSREEAHKIRIDYLNGMPKLKQLLERETTYWRNSAQRYEKWGKTNYKNGYIKGLDGRPILVEAEHTILVYYLQSDEAIQMATAYVWFFKDMERAGYVYGVDYGTVMFMHDEIDFECKPEIVNEASKIAAACIKKAGEYYKIKVPHEGDSKVGKNWYEVH